LLQERAKRKGKKRGIYREPHEQERTKKKGRKKNFTTNHTNRSERRGRGERRILPLTTRTGTNEEGGEKEEFYH